MAHINWGGQMNGPVHSVLDAQVGDSHYKDLKVQPFIVCEAAAKIGGFKLGNVFKYLCRYPFKGCAVQDLNKAKHYIELYLEFNPVPFYIDSIKVDDLAENCVQFIQKNALGKEQASLLAIAMVNVLSHNFNTLLSAIDEEIDNQQENTNG